jgi:drug/metabolite transporter (DMT)-like permease
MGMCGYILLSRAYQVANASLVAPFDYTYLPLATAMAFFLFDEVPGTNTLVGMALIVAGGLYLGFRELRATRGTEEAPVVAETVYAPGSPHPSQIPDDESLT